MKLLNISCMVNADGSDNGFTKAMKGICDEYREIAVSLPDLNDNISSVLSYFKPDVVFIQIQAKGLLKSTIEDIKATNAFIIHWSGDVRSPLPDFYIEMAHWGCDLTCFSNMEDVRTMRALGFKSSFLQIGYDPEIYKSDGEKYDAPEIVFMGNNCGGFPLSQYRKEMVQFLRSTYGNRFGLYGSGWGDLANGNYMGNQHGEACIYRGAKIGINLSHFDYERYTSDRMFRMAGCGLCIISHDYQSVREDFENGNNIWLWENFQMLKEQIDFALKYFDLAKTFGKRINELAKENHTFTKMAQQIRQLYEQR
jgi:glycosyltransferase involved in cell wall biosynthesis